MFACWLTYGYFNTISNKSQQKMTKKALFLAAFFPIEIGTLSPIISLKHAKFLALAGIEVCPCRIREFWVVYGLKRKGKKGECP
jgi:hypothetical protein